MTDECTVPIVVGQLFVAPEIDSQGGFRLWVAASWLVVMILVTILKAIKLFALPRFMSVMVLLLVDTLLDMVNLSIHTREKPSAFVGLFLSTAQHILPQMTLASRNTNSGLLILDSTEPSEANGIACLEPVDGGRTVFGDGHHSLFLCLVFDSAPLPLEGRSDWSPYKPEVYPESTVSPSPSVHICGIKMARFGYRPGLRFLVWRRLSSMLIGRIALTMHRCIVR